MTREEAILKIGELVAYARIKGWDDVYTDAFKTLEQESILDKIRAEIKEEISDHIGADNYDAVYGLQLALYIINKYNAVESEVQND